VASYHCDGSCDLAYDNVESEQFLNLLTAEWCYVAVYRPDKPSAEPSASTSTAASFPKTCYSSLHKAKGFVDHFTVISKDTNSHQHDLSSLVLKASDICLEFQPQNVFPLTLIAIVWFPLQCSLWQMEKLYVIEMYQVFGLYYWYICSYC